MGWRTNTVLRRHRISLMPLYLYNLGANATGFLSVALLNVVTPLHFFKIQRKIIFSEGGWPEFFLFFPLALLLVVMVQYRIQLPISKVKGLVVGDSDIPEHMRDKARRRLLNLPYIIGLINLIIYLVTPCLVALSLYLMSDIPVKVCLFLIFRALMLGIIVAFVSFFLIEDHLRRKLIPLFFPEGRLANFPGAIKISILRRIRLLYGTGTLNPMIILVVTMLFILWDMEENPVSAVALARDVLFFTLVLCTIFVLIALRLNFMVGKSILAPIKEMLRIVEKVRGGDFTRTIQVVSSDEMGILGDAGNDMISGLAERERIRETFGKYVTPEIRDQILAGQIPVEGERRIATLLFSDLRDFTLYVEETAPEEVIRGMRAYFTAMQHAIRRHHGLVLQYVGDEIEAVFGVPVSYEGHADQAVLAALEMRKSLSALNEARRKEGKPSFRHGIGIHTGSVLAGNTGSDDRLSYTLIGNTVNLASRIQDMTKTVKCDILVSEETVKVLKNSFQMKKEQPQTAKGYSRPISVYKLM